MFTFRCPAHCSLSYVVVVVLSKHMSNPSSSCLGDNGANILLFDLFDFDWGKNVQKLDKKA